MSRLNAVRAAPAETVRDPRKADLCGAAIKQLNTQARGRRQARRGAVSSALFWGASNLRASITSHAASMENGSGDSPGTTPQLRR
jgi:hypothetical protein